MDTVVWDAVLVGETPVLWLLTTVCLLFWSERTGACSATAWLVCARKGWEAAGKSVLMHHVLGRIIANMELPSYNSHMKPA